MKILNKSVMGAAILAAALVSVLAPRASAQTGTVGGQIMDVNGKPWAGLTVQVVSDQGAKQTAKTDPDGKYNIPGLRSGIYTVTITAFPPPNDKQPPYEFAKVQVKSGEEAPANANFKDIMAKQGAAAQEQVKKQEEAKTKFEGMKAHFLAGNALLEQEKAAKAELQKAPAAERDAAKQKLSELTDQAAKEYKAAQESAGEKDTNVHLLWAKLGEAYDTGGRNEEAAQAYQQAIAAKPDAPAGYYNNLGNVLARMGKIDEAKAAYTKSAELDPTNAATAWRNFGISLYNANRLGDAVEPLQKSAELDPKNAQTWYLLGASLVYKMTLKRVGDKEVPEFAPGTIEAYQKAIELDPNGTYGQQAKAGLEQLQQMAPGIDLKVNVRKKKS